MCSKQQSDGRDSEVQKIDEPIRSQISPCLHSFKLLINPRKHREARTQLSAHRYDGDIIDDLKGCIATVNGPRASLSMKKFEKILLINSGLKMIRLIFETIQGDDIGDEIPDYAPCEFAVFTYVPLVSVDVEISFFRYKNLLSDRRYSLTAENVRFHVAPLCNVSDHESSCLYSFTKVTRSFSLCLSARRAPTS